MTSAKAQDIRDRDGVHVNPIEKNILFYTLRILRLGFQLHFVFDGPKRLSSGGKSYPGHDAPSLLLRDTLTYIGVHWHDAPAEAEAECAKMEMVGDVDGVWSDDGNALAFGCQTLIKFFHESTSSTERGPKSSEYFIVYKLEDLARQYPGMDREGFILSAILNGRPNKIGQLYNLGPQDVLKAAGQGLGKSLCAASRSGKDLRPWATTDFATYLKATGSNIEIPPEFPRWEHVQDYLNPVTSTSEVLLDLLKPSDPAPDERTLFPFLVEKFQWTLKQWALYFVPLIVVRSLLATEEGKESQHDFLKLECDWKKKSLKKMRATFLLSKATSLDVSTLYLEKGVLETLPWIIRKANFNGQRSINSYGLTPKSNEKGKGRSPLSVSGQPPQKLQYGADRVLLTPQSGSASNLNGEGPSTRREPLRQRQSTPPSPTPVSRKRKLPCTTDASISKNIQPASKNGSRTLVQEKVSGKGKGKAILAPPRAHAKRAGSPPARFNSISNEGLCEKRPRRTVEQHPSKPLAQSTEPADAVHDFITIDADSDQEPNLVAKQLPSTPPAQVSEPDDTVIIDSDSDEDSYGSGVSVAHMLSLLEDVAVQAVQDDNLESLSSGDEFGSVPATQDLLDLL